RRPLPKPQAGATAGALEIQPAGAFVTCRGSLKNPGGFTISVALDLQRMEPNPRHKFRVRARRRLRICGHPGVARATRSDPLYLLLDCSWPLGRARLPGWHRSGRKRGGPNPREKELAR